MLHGSEQYFIIYPHFRVSLSLAASVGPRNGGTQILYIDTLRKLLTQLILDAIAIVAAFSEYCTLKSKGKSWWQFSDSRDVKIAEH